METHELAWAAGFFDGEGWAGSVGQRGRATRQPQARINQAGQAGMPDVLVRFREALGGLGRIGGPRVQKGRQDLYHWSVSSRHDVERLMALLAPHLGEVKLRALAAALDRVAPPSAAVCRGDQEWIAWAAGLYDGEGSLYLVDHRSHDGYRIPELSITQASASGVPEVLARFAAIVGAGRVYGPYAQRAPHAPTYRFKCVVARDIESIVAVLWPWLGRVKRRQAQSVVDVVRGQEPLPRGNPEWGNNKIFCVNGHEYATARIRAFVPRNGGTEPRPSSQCLACLREYARRRRLERRSETGDHR